MMAYVGSEGSSSGFHRCFSSTVALNLLVESDRTSLDILRSKSILTLFLDRPVVCIGTDFESQKAYDTFITARGVSPHLDWLNLSSQELGKAEFPLYVYDQRVGDLVVFPPATAHQVWNPSTLSTKLVWNILHPLSLEVGFQHVQPPFNRLCHPDVARTNLSLACAMLSLIREDTPVTHPPDLPLLTRLFRQMVHDESFEGAAATPIQSIRVPDTMIATCNFCSTALWNRHVRCSECVDFDLCLLCYLSGRSCEHSQSYSWAELIPQETCMRVLSRAREILGFQTEEPRMPDRQKTLGAAVNDLMRAKQSNTMRLCHLCRIEHADWKGRRCDKCTAFFCYRGLFRHFDMNSSDVVRHAGLWTCPKCLETCNCRCCHFATAYVKSEKPASKRRVKPADARGKIMGFTDNVFDQKRGQRQNASSSAESSKLPGISHLTSSSKKRPASSVDFDDRSLKADFLTPTPEPDMAYRFGLGNHRVLESIDAKYANVHNQSNGVILPPTVQYERKYLPSIKTLPEQQLLYSMKGGSEHSIPPNAVPEGMKTLASAAVSRSRVPDPLPLTPTRPSMLSPYSIPDSAFSVAAPPSKAGFTPSELPEYPFKFGDRTAAVDDSIRILEQKLLRMKHIGAELLQLNMEDSHRALLTQIASAEQELLNKKREKSTSLLETLQSDFPGLADIARKEVEKLGYA